MARRWCRHPGYLADNDGSVVFGLQFSLLGCESNCDHGVDGSFFDLVAAVPGAGAGAGYHSFTVAPFGFS